MASTVRHPSNPVCPQAFSLKALTALLCVVAILTTVACGGDGRDDAARGDDPRTKNDLISERIDCQFRKFPITGVNAVDIQEAKNEAMLNSKDRSWQSLKDQRDRVCPRIHLTPTPRTPVDPGEAPNG